MPIASRKQAWRGRKRPVAATSRPFSLPPPLGGVNALSGLAGMEASEAVVLVNLIPARYGCRVRSGYVEWQRIADFEPGGDAEPIPQEARTVMPYFGSKDDKTKDRLFVATKYGIYDCSEEGTLTAGEVDNPPDEKIVFTTASADSGYGTFVHYTNDGAGHFLIYADAQNGLYQYSEATDAWAKYHLDAAADPLHIQNVDPALLTFVTVWKHRLWFGEKDSARSWYLGPGLLSGAATEFDFGNKFRYSGSIAGIFNWTLNGGAGIDDYLVAVSREGDVLVYMGTNPDDAATFEAKGIWYVGPVAKGKRCATEYGGELLLLTLKGAIPLSTLVNGAVVESPQTYITDKISPLLSDTFSSTEGKYGWGFCLSPKDDSLIILSPYLAGYSPRQFVMDTASRKWAVQLDVPMNCADVWHGDLHFGTLDGRVCIHKGSSDNTLLDGTVGEAVDWYTITSFQTLETPAMYKRVSFIRPVFTGAAVPAYTIGVRYDYDTSVPPVSVGGVVVSAAEWDTSLWDGAAWGGSNLIYQRTSGAAGMGRTVAVVLRGRSQAPLSLVSFEGAVDVGGFL
jgi:hypothetical protein